MDRPSSVNRLRRHGRLAGAWGGAERRQAALPWILLAGCLLALLWLAGCAGRDGDTGTVGVKARIFEVEGACTSGFGTVDVAPTASVQVWIPDVGREINVAALFHQDGSDSVYFTCGEAVTFRAVLVQ